MNHSSGWEHRRGRSEGGQGSLLFQDIQLICNVLIFLPFPSNPHASFLKCSMYWLEGIWSPFSLLWWPGYEGFPCSRSPLLIHIDVLQMRIFPHLKRWTRRGLLQHCSSILSCPTLPSQRNHTTPAQFFYSVFSLHPSGSSLGQKLTRFPLLKNSKRVIRKQSSNNVCVKVWALLLRSSEWSWLQGTAGHLLLGFYLTWIFLTNLPSLKYASKWFLSGISPYSISLPEEKHRNHVTVLTTTISQTPKCQLPHHYTRQDIPEPEPGPSSIVNEAGPYLKDFHLCSPH